MESDMDEEMEDTFEGGFYVNEEVEQIDFDYEYDASKYFDFSRDESRFETEEAESWFSSAETYPPSPFVLKLNLGEDNSGEDVNISPKSRDTVDTDMVMDTNTSQMDGDCKGLTFYNHMAKDIRPPKLKSAIKTTLSKGSTLMKPTASQLAKQSQRGVHATSRFLGRSQTSLLQQNQKSLESLVIESQAAKRQKLESGHLPKAVDTKQPTSLIHKTSKKCGPADGNTTLAKLKLTIPRQPDLETAHRAQRTRPKNSTEIREQVKPPPSMFRARPLNRKILEAPSLPLSKKSTPRLPAFQEFHLKTSERAMQHSNVPSSASLTSNKSDKMANNIKASSTAQNRITELPRSSTVDTLKQEVSETIHTFKARPLNKKIFSSKGDIGVFRNTKREATTPMEFKFSTEKRLLCHPPVDLFNKLSLTSELQNKPGHQPKLPRVTCLPTKGLKENTDNACQQQQRTMNAAKEKSQRFGGKQFQCGVDKDISEIGSRANLRSLDIR